VTARTRPGARATPADAHRAELGLVEVTFTWDGETYTLPHPDTWDLDVFEYVELNQMVLAAKALLGPVQWARYRAKRRTFPDLLDMFNQMWAAAGVNPGE
jgi:hypothetical protein